MRGISEWEVDQAWTALSAPDPAGQLRGVSRDQVVEVAAYLSEFRNGVWVVNPAWELIRSGHPAARAVYVHGAAETEAQRRLRVHDPLWVPHWGDAYWIAHAWACWGKCSTGKPGQGRRDPLSQLQPSCMLIRHEAFSQMRCPESTLFHAAPGVWTPRGSQSPRPCDRRSCRLPPPSPASTTQSAGGSERRASGAERQRQGRRIPRPGGESQPSAGRRSRVAGTMGDCLG